MASGNIKTVYEIFQSMESGPTSAPTYPNAQVHLTSNVGNKYRVVFPKAGDVWSHFSLDPLEFIPVGPIKHVKFINSLLPVTHKTNM